MFRSLTIAMLLAFAAALGVTSCATVSQIETSWRVPAYRGEVFSKLAVIAILRHHDESKAFEIAADQTFSRAGLEVVPGFTFLGSDTLLPQDELEKRVETTGADGVLIFKLIAVDRSRTYIPPTAFVVDAPPPYDDWWRDRYWGYYTPYPYHYWGYWYPAIQVVGAPGYWTINSTYQIESALYRTSDNKLVWTAMSGTYDPSGEYDLGSSLSKAVVKKLQKDGLIPGMTRSIGKTRTFGRTRTL